MSEPENKPPAEVLRTKRLEIVDDEGKIRAVLGTDEAGVTSLSVFDQSERLRISLDASENSEQANGLGVFDTQGGLRVSVGAGAVNVNEGGLDCYGTNGEPRAGVHVNEKGGALYFNDTNGKDRVGLAMHEKGGGLFFNDANGERRAGLNVDEKSSSLYINDSNGKSRGGLGVYEDGQAGLSFSAAEKDRDIKMAAWKDGNLYLMLTESGMPMATLGLTEGEGKVLSSDLALTGKDGRSGVVVSGGRSFDPFVRLIDRHETVRGSFDLSDGNTFRDASRNTFNRVLAERSLVYQALFYGAVLFASVFGGAWIAGKVAATASTSFYSLPAAVITVVVLAALVGWLIMGRRR